VEVPAWLTRQKKGVLEKISDDDTVAQVLVMIIANSAAWRTDGV
jgi:hypothetical protein